MVGIKFNFNNVFSSVKKQNKIMNFLFPFCNIFTTKDHNATERSTFLPYVKRLIIVFQSLLKYPVSNNVNNVLFSIVSAKVDSDKLYPHYRALRLLPKYMCLRCESNIFPPYQSCQNLLQWIILVAEERFIIFKIFYIVINIRRS